MSSTTENLLLLSMTINAFVVTFTYYYIKDTRVRIKKFREKTKRLLKANKAKAKQEANELIEKKAYKVNHLTRLKLLAEQSEGRIKKDMIELQQKTKQVLLKLLEKNKDCGESHYKTHCKASMLKLLTFKLRVRI